MKYKTIRFKVNYVMFQVAAKFSFIFGLAPCKINLCACSSKRNTVTIKFSFSLLACAWNILLKILFLTIAISIEPYLKEITYPNNSKTIMTIIITLSVFGNLNAVFVISLYSLRQKHVINIGNQLNYFDETFGTKLFTTNNDMMEDIWNIATILMLLVIWCGFYATTYILSEKVYLVAGICLTLHSLLLIQYSLIINSLRERLKGINEAFLTIARFPIVFQDNITIPGNILNNRLNIRNFFMIKQARNMIHNISCQVTEFYSLPVLVVIFYLCCCFIDSLYFVITAFLSSGHFDVAFINPIFWCLMSAHPVIMLSASVNSFQSEMDRTAKVLYGIMESYIPNKEMECQLNAFAVELLHKKVPFTACGLFSLDCVLLHSIFGMVVTYILILLQFKPTDSL